MTQACPARYAEPRLTCGASKPSERGPLSHHWVSCAPGARGGGGVLLTEPFRGRLDPVPMRINPQLSVKKSGPGVGGSGRQVGGEGFGTRPRY